MASLEACHNHRKPVPAVRPAVCVDREGECWRACFLSWASLVRMKGKTRGGSARARREADMASNTLLSEKWRLI